MIDLSDNELLEAIELLYLGYRAFTCGPDAILEKRGLGRSHHRILYFVGRDPGLSVGDLLSILSISKQALHTPLRQLLAMELVEMKRAKGDGRIKRLRLTASGRRLEQRLTQTQTVQLKRVFDTVGPDAEDSWREVMTHLAGR